MENIEMCVQVLRNASGSDIATPFGTGGINSTHVLTYRTQQETIGVAVSSCEKLSVFALCLAQYIRCNRTCSSLLLYALQTNKEHVVFAYSAMPVAGMSHWRENKHWQSSNAELFELPVLVSLLRDSKSERKISQHLTRIRAMPLMPEFDSSAMR